MTDEEAAQAREAFAGVLGAHERWSAANTYVVETMDDPDDDWDDLVAKTDRFAARMNEAIHALAEWAGVNGSVHVGHVLDLLGGVVAVRAERAAARAEAA